MRSAWLLLLLTLAGCGQSVLPGAACTKHEQCDGLRDGYCAKAEICTRECSDTDPCPEPFSKCRLQGSRRVCLPVCADDTNCLKGFVCQDADVCVVAAPLAPLPK